MTNSILNKNNIMVDIETLSTDSNALILSIGAVKFNETITDHFYTTISIESSLKVNRLIDASTIEWWMLQDDKARALFSDPNKLDLYYALLNLKTWLGSYPIIWGYGASFDNVILENAYKVLNIETPWFYKNSLCYRTLSTIYPNIKFIFEGVKHNALDDAKTQAVHLIKILKHIERTNNEI